jgi:hypothetical protein
LRLQSLRFGHLGRFHSTQIGALINFRIPPWRVTACPRLNRRQDFRLQRPGPKNHVYPSKDPVRGL